MIDLEQNTQAHNSKKTPSLVSRTHYLGWQLAHLGYTDPLIEGNPNLDSAFILNSHNLLPIILKSEEREYIAWPIVDSETQSWGKVWFAIDRKYKTPRDYSAAVEARCNYLAENPEEN